MSTASHWVHRGNHPDISKPPSATESAAVMRFYDTIVPQVPPPTTTVNPAALEIRRPTTAKMTVPKRTRIAPAKQAPRRSTKRAASPLPLSPSEAPTPPFKTLKECLKRKRDSVASFKLDIEGSTIHKKRKTASFTPKEKRRVLSSGVAQPCPSPCECNHDSTLPSAPIDSGYISGITNSESPLVSAESAAEPSTTIPEPRPSVELKLPVPSLRPVPAHTASPPAKGADAIKAYRRRMQRSSEKFFMKNYVSKQFTHDPVAARKSLEPSMRIALDRMEDRQKVEKLFLVVDSEASTIRSEVREVPWRWERRPMDRAYHQLEGNDYFKYRPARR